MERPCRSTFIVHANKANGNPASRRRASIESVNRSNSNSIAPRRVLVLKDHRINDRADNDNWRLYSAMLSARTLPPRVPAIARRRGYRLSFFHIHIVCSKRQTAEPLYRTYKRIVGRVACGFTEIPRFGHLLPAISSTDRISPIVSSVMSDRGADF
jgi:hypothetical protein